MGDISSARSRIGAVPVVHMVLTPLGVGSKGHSQASMVGKIFTKSKVSVHGGVGDGII